MSATTTLSDEDKREIGQHFVFGFHGYNVTTEIDTLIRDYHLGHVILMKRNVQSAEQVYDLIEKLQAIAKDAGHDRPLMIGTDQENGLVSAFSVARSDAAGTQFPGAMALAASGSVKLAEEVYNASAKELKLVGINWAYSPVADVNSDPRNPVIGVRSFGDDPDVVGRFVAAASRGLTSGGVAPSLKHFPGHGDTHVDSHLALPVIPKDLDALKRTELVPFAACLDAATIMTGHMALPTLTGNDSPASLSRAATYGLAREQLKYDGAIVTDCLEMDAVAAREGGVPRGAVEALKAGADVVMACHTYSRHVGTVEAVYAAVASGEISRDELVDSGKRVTALKDKFAGSWTDVLPGSKSFPHDEWLRLKAAHKDLSVRAYAATTALVQDPANLLPIQPVAHKIVLITPIPESLNLAVDDAEGVMRTRDGKSVRNTAGPSYLALADAVRAHRPDGVIHLICGPEQEADIDENAVRDADVVLFVTRNAHSARWQLEQLRRVASVRGGVQNGVIVVQSCAPYDLLGMEANDDLAKATVLATFEFTSEGLAAAVAVVFGEHKAAGVVPVCGGKIVG